MCIRDRFDGSFGSMRRFKDDVNVVKRGYECGLGIEMFQDIKVGDILEAYKICLLCTSRCV